MNPGTSVSVRFRHLAVVAACVAIVVSCGVSLAQDKTPPTKAQPKPEVKGQVPDLVPAVRDPRKQTIPDPTVQLKPGEVPAIKFDVPVYNFGRVMAGKPIEYEYYFTNLGNGPLEILKVRPSCSCTLAGEYSKIVKPGETGKIPVKLDTSKLGGRETTKSIAVYTNIPGPDKEVRLTMVGDVWLGIKAEPQMASFGSMTIQEAEQKPTTKVILTNNMDKPLKLENIVSTHPAFKPELRVLEPGKRYEVILTLVDAKATGGIVASIEMDTGVGALPKYALPVRARIHPPLTVVPGKIVMGPGRQAALDRKVTISNNTKDPVEISDVKCTNDAIKVVFRELRPKKLFRLEVTLPEGYQPGEVEDKITFKTTCPSAPEVTIPITTSPDTSDLGRAKVQKAE